MKKAFFLFPAALLLSGCSLFEDSTPAPGRPAEPIRVEMEITERSAAPQPAAEPTPAPRKEAAKRAKNKPVTPPPPQVQEKRGGLDGELNDVERSYLDGIRKRNKQTREENANQVFGGWGL